MLILSMLDSSKISGISIFMILFIILSQNTIGISEKNEIQDTTIYDWHQTNLFFITHGYSKDVTSNTIPIDSTCIQKDTRLRFHYHSGIWPLYPTFMIMNKTEIVSTFKIDHCSCNISNFSGLIIHQLSIISDAWYIIGYCSELTIKSGY